MQREKEKMASKAGKKRKIVGNRNTKLFYYARVFSFLFVVLFFSSSTSCFFFSLLVARTCASCQKRIQHWRRIACNFPISNERYFCIKFILHHPMCDVCVCEREWALATGRNSVICSASTFCLPFFSFRNALWSFRRRLFHFNWYITKVLLPPPPLSNRM